MEGEWVSRLHWRRFELRTSDSPDEARERIAGLAERLPTLLPPPRLDVSDDIGFDDDETRGTGPPRGRWGAARFDGPRFSLHYGRGRMLGVWGRIEPAPGGCVVHVELGMMAPSRLMFPVLAVLQVVAVLASPERLMVLVVAAFWIGIGYVFVRHAGRLEASVRDAFPAPEGARAGPFR